MHSEESLIWLCIRISDLPPSRLGYGAITFSYKLENGEIWKSHSYMKLNSWSEHGGFYHDWCNFNTTASGCELKCESFELFLSQRWEFELSMSRRKTRNFVWAITLLFFSLGMFIYWFILDLWSLIFSQKATQFIPTGTLSMHHLFVHVCPLIFARIGTNVLIFTLQLLTRPY